MQETNPSNHPTIFVLSLRKSEYSVSILQDISQIANRFKTPVSCEETDEYFLIAMENIEAYDALKKMTDPGHISITAETPRSPAP